MEKNAGCARPSVLRSLPRHPQTPPLRSTPGAGRAQRAPHAIRVGASGRLYAPRPSMRWMLRHWSVPLQLDQEVARPAAVVGHRPFHSRRSRGRPEHQSPRLPMHQTPSRCFAPGCSAAGPPQGAVPPRHFFHGAATTAGPNARQASARPELSRNAGKWPLLQPDVVSLLPRTNCKMGMPNLHSECSGRLRGP